MNILRPMPFFWRPNGIPVDLVDLYAGSGPLFLCLNGPSFGPLQRRMLTGRPGIMTMGTNNGAHLFRPDLWTCVDDPRRFLASIWRDPKILKLVPEEHFGKPANGGALVGSHPAVVGFRRNDHFRAEWFLWENTINWGNSKARGGGRSCMLVALRLAWLLGFRRVYLVGCDFTMGEQPGQGYWFPETRTAGAVKNNLNSYRIMQGYFDALQPFFLEAAFRVYNCNPESRLTSFPHADLSEAVAAAEARLDLAASTEGMYVQRPKIH